MFWTRLVSGIVLVLLAIGVFTCGGYVLWAALFGLSVVAYLEVTRACGLRKDGKITALEIAGIGSTGLYYLMFVGMEIGLLKQDHFWIMLAIGIAFLAQMFVYVFGFPKYRSEQVMSSFFAFFYGPVCLSFIGLTRGLEGGAYLVWLIMLCSWGCDTCAYCVGVLFGKHKMSPILSPKKSMEGAVGGVVGAALLGAGYGYFTMHSSSEAFFEGATVMFAVICVVGALISMVGDLAASAIKRNHEIKDYGKLIPGHGGVMDRFDSVIFTAPIIYFMVFLYLRG